MTVFQMEANKFAYYYSRVLALGAAMPELSEPLFKLRVVGDRLARLPAP